MFDLVQYCMWRACEEYGHRCEFNTATFAGVFRQVTGGTESLDGRVIAAVLCGRSDVERLAGGSHYRLIVDTDDATKGSTHADGDSRR